VRVAKPHFLGPLLRASAGTHALRNNRTGITVATVLETAFESATRNRGLLGRSGLPPEHALILAPSNFVHTFFMQFPIDVLFVARDGTVLKARRAVPARRIVGALRAFAVIELAAHALDRSQTVAGDRLSIAPS
jgi:uncharacterized membrane protein (UPF0127 family)